MATITSITVEIARKAGLKGFSSSEIRLSETISIAPGDDVTEVREKSMVRLRNRVIKEINKIVESDG